MNMIGSLFTQQAMCNFEAMESYMQDSIKGLHHVSLHFAVVGKELLAFQESLAKSLSPLNDFLNTSKNNRSLNKAFTMIAGNLAKCYDSMKNEGKMYKQESAVAIKRFADKYQNYALEVLNDGRSLIGEVEASKQKVNKARATYSKHERELFRKGVSRSNRELKEAKSRYQNLLKEHNKLLKVKSEEYQRKLDKLEANEKKRMELILKTAERTISIVESLATQLKDLSINSRNQLKSVNPESDLKKAALGFENGTRIDTFSELFFADHGAIYQFIDQLNNGKLKDSYGFIDSTAVMHTDGKALSPGMLSEECKAVQAMCKELLSGKNLSKEDVIRMTDSFADENVRKVFIKELKSVTNSHFIADFSVFETLGLVTNYLLTTTSLYTDIDPFVTYNVLCASFIIYSKHSADSPIIALNELISGNTIWFKQEQWIELIQFRLIEALTRVHLKLVPDEKKIEKDVQASLFMRSAIYTELSIIASQIPLMGISKRQGEEILLQFAGYYGINNENLRDVLTNYASAQPLEHDHEFSKRELTEIISKGAAGKIEKYGENSRYFIITKAIAYIGDIKTLKSLLILNKSLNKVLRRKIYKMALDSIDVTEKQRKEIWKLAIFDPKYCKIYEEIKEKLRNPSEADKENIAKIQLDIARSFQKHSAETQAVSSLSLPRESSTSSPPTLPSTPTRSTAKECTWSADSSTTCIRMKLCLLVCLLL
eukprot:TRINITY_DN10151_c0_g1_i4.p1 TRINITY_DN10151_c0_g1~~TRINITY_DN10151_c0_g1_i4.p1  ORF type:complete len:713 (-),score=129.98 TRINITY_DN10151_c0_g1_i4:252-2390(-)